MAVGDGSVRRVEAGQADFDGMVVNLGAFGIVTACSLRSSRPSRSGRMRLSICRGTS
jgi:hypothetical protein